MEAVGAASALADLLILSIKVSKAAKSLVQSFLSAPKELIQLTIKLDRLHSLIEQLHNLGGELPVSDSLVLLPPEHQAMLWASLQTNFEALQMIQSLCSSRSGKSGYFGTRLRWALLDKKKAGRILGMATKAESELNTVLAILGVRLASLNNNSLGAISTSQALLHAGLRESTEAVKAWIHIEIQGLVQNVDVSQNYRENLLSTLTQSSISQLEAAENSPDDDLDHLTYSRRSRDTIDTDLETRQRKEIAHNENLGCLKPAIEYSSNRDKREKQRKLISKVLPSTDIIGQIDPETRLMEHDMRKSLGNYFVTFGSLRESSTSNKPTVGASVAIQSKRNRRKLRFVFDIGFKIFCQHVMQFELNLKQTTRQWTGMPKFDCSMTIFNVRPEDALIFRACREWNINKIKYLLENGQASVYDVNDKNGGLLEHVVIGPNLNCWYLESRTLHQIQQTLEHLLDYGCDPNVFYGTIDLWRVPAVLCAFGGGYSSAVSTMLSRGADILSFGSMLAGFFRELNAGFTWKIELARALGYSDWNTELHLASGPSDSILHGACEEANLQEVLFALEIAGIDPNLEASANRTALGYAAEAGFLKGAAILVECGAEIDSSKDSVRGTPMTLSYGLHLRAPEIARSWIYGLERDVDRRVLPQEWISDFENAEEMRAPRFSFSWSPSGLVYKKSLAKDYQYPRDTEAAEMHSSSTKHPEETKLPQVSDNTTKNASDDGKNDSTDTTDSKVAEILINIKDPKDEDLEGSTFFRNQTQFYHYISSPEGRRKLSRFPLVLALCSALQFAGYRAEMDDEGDIWYEIEDGDRYFDARENQPEEDLDDSTKEFCPICQDFEGHGLGHILREVEEAKCELFEYREKVKTKRNYF